MKELPHKWKFKDVYNDGDPIAVDEYGTTTAWIEESDSQVGDVLALADKNGVAHAYIPLDVIDALRKKA